MLMILIVSGEAYLLIALVLSVCILTGIFLYIYDDLSTDVDGEIDVDEDNWDDVVDYLDMVTPEDEDDKEDT